MTQFASRIAGVTILELVTYADDRGFFREVLRTGMAPGLEPILQVSHSRMKTGVVKAWHLHQNQVEGWYVASGVVKLVLHDLRTSSPSRAVTEEWMLGDEQVSRFVCVPPGVAHGCKCITGPADLIYLETMTYNPEEDQRIPQNDASIGYDWGQ